MMHETLRDLWSEGYRAGLAGWKVSACPRDGRTVEGRTWREGWKVGAAHYEQARAKAVGLAVDLLEGRT